VVRKKKRAVKFFAGTLRKVEKQVNDYFRGVEELDWADVRFVPFGPVVVAMVFTETKEYVEKRKKEPVEIDIDKIFCDDLEKGERGSKQ
jgi:hypothetical protein